MHRFLNRAREAPVPAISENRGVPWKRILVVSNRLPFNVTTDETGRPSILPSSGGLVTAMSPLMKHGIAGKWIGWPGGQADEEGGLEEALRSQESTFDIGVVPLSPEEVRDYYGGYANEVLAPAFAEQPEKIDRMKAYSCRKTYMDVQAKFAEAILADLSEGDIVWVHDYHLMGVGKVLRDHAIKQPVGFFLHMPFPALPLLRAILHHGEILRQLLAYDVLGFQTSRFARNFVEALRACVPAARVWSTSPGAWRVRFGGHVTRVGSFPISIDTNEFERQLYAPDTQRYAKKLASCLRKGAPGKKIVFDAGRSDYSKGFLEELQAIEKLLTMHPELVDQLVFFQLVIPSRGDIKAYRAYRQKIQALSAQLNARFGRKVVRQIHTTMGRARYLAHLHAADVLSVPSLSDGMNLVCKEGAIVGKPSMVLLLGENAGAAEEFSSDALLIDPADIDAFAHALHQAITMPETERLKSKRAIKSIVTRNDVMNWWSEQEPFFLQAWQER